MDENQTNEKDKKTAEHKRTFAGTLFSTIGSFVTAAAVIVLICNFVFPVFKVTGNSMVQSDGDGTKQF